MAQLTILSKLICARISVIRTVTTLARYKWVIFLPLVLILSACVNLQDPESSQEYRSDTIAELQSGHTFGQSFVSRRDNLQNIQVWLRPSLDSNQAVGRLIAELYRKPGEGAPLYSASFDLATLVKGDSLRIPFKGQAPKLSAGSYYLQIKTEGNAISLYGRSEDAYAQGQAYLDDHPIDADLGFRTSYEYDFSSVHEDLVRWLGQLWLILPLAIALWLPGRVLLRLTNFDHRLDWGERTAIAIGLSIACLPVLMLWTTQIGLEWNRISTWFVAGILIIVYIYSLHPTRWKIRNISKFSIYWPSLALAAVVLFSLAVRLAMIRDLAGPAWVDSVHHALLGRMIMEQGGFPTTYTPYLQISTTNYHVGYHSVLATFAWLSGLDLAQAVLIFGQVLNTLAVLAVYLLTTTFTRRPTAGIFAALICGLMTPMPAYHTSWGRYTELTGLLILPVAFYFIKSLVDQSANIFIIRRIQKENLILIGLACVSVAGLLLVHYRVLAFLICLVSAYVLICWIEAAFQHHLKQKLVGNILILIMVSGIALLITVPWWPSTLHSFVVPIAKDTGTGIAFSDFSWSYLNTAFGKYALGLAGLGFIWSLAQRKTFGLVLLLWIVGMFALANLGYFHLPGASFINNTSVAILLFMPTAVLGGYLLGWVMDGWSVWVPNMWKPTYWGAVSLTAIALALVSAKALLPILNPGTLLIRQADLPAIQWIADYSPPDAKFIINPFLWGYGIYAGNDGGYWITPLTGRLTLPPPALYGYDFTGGSAQRISENARRVQELAKDPAGLYKLMKELEIGYIYIGARGGVLSPKLLEESPSFNKLFEKDGVYIFKAR